MKKQEMPEMHWNARIFSKLARGLVYFAIGFPVLFILYMLSGHAALEDIYYYNPTFGKLIFLLALVVLTALALFTDVKNRRKASGITLALSCVSIVVSGYFAASVILPKYIRHGEIAPRNFFSSSARKTGPFRFAAAGDAHIGNSESRTDLTCRMIEHIRQDNYDAFFLLGDLVDHGFDYSLWNNAFKEMELLNRTIPVCYVPGNHDTIFGGEDLYRKYCLPENDRKLWRRIDRGNIHFLVLDVEWGTQTFTKEQEQWLIRQLEGIPREDWCIVMSHSFYYCSGRRKDGWDWYDNEALIKRLSPLFEKYGVELVLSGHMHQMELLKKGGVIYAIMGSFGGRLDRGREYVSPASVWYKARQYGFADVTINGNDAILKVRDPDDNVIYSLNFSNR
ncbi:MAG: metallophosphoesterase [Spirochaetes bacterium]|nr:metallophosphoesterase [Spirochaetota bacterium]